MWRLTWLLTHLALFSSISPALAATPDSYYYHDGELAGSLRSDRPLPLFDADPEHLWNRLFASFYIRTSAIRSQPGGPPITRVEGGDWIDFLGWSGTSYWSEAATCQRLTAVLDEFNLQAGGSLLRDPLKRAILQRDLWAAYDYFIGLNIQRIGDRATMRRREQVAQKLAIAIRGLALAATDIKKLPDTYPLAVATGKFAAESEPQGKSPYLPPGLLTASDEWVEIDFFQPDLHEDLSSRFVTLHTRTYRGRSYFRIFFRFPGGRKQFEAYTRYLDSEGIDWRKSAQQGFVQLVDGVRPQPIGTEVALVQFMNVLDDKLQPTPTGIVESVRLRVFRNVDGTSTPPTNTGQGVDVYEYTLKRRLLLDGLLQGGLEPERPDLPQYRVIFQRPRNEPDWGQHGRSQTMAEQCMKCHTGQGFGAASLVSLVHQGGFDAGAQLGVAVPLPPGTASPRGPRAVKFKLADETYRRLVDHVQSHEESPARWEPQIRALEAKFRQSRPLPGGNVFIGSSSIRGWDLARSFPSMTAVNHGFGGSQLVDSAFYADRLVVPLKPKVVVLYAGDNDLASGKSPEQVLADYRSFVRNVHSALPDVTIVYIGIKPSLSRWRLIDSIRTTNRLIREAADADMRLVFVDIEPVMLGQDGLPRKEFFVADGLHMTAAGYDAWAERVRPHLAK